MFSALCGVNQAIAKLSTSAQWKPRTTRSQTRTTSRCAWACAGKARSVFAGFGIVELLQRLGIVGGVDLLAVLVDRIDLVAALLGLDLAHGEALALQLRLERRLGLELRFRGGAAGAGRQRRSGDHAREGGDKKSAIHGISIRLGVAARLGNQPTGRDGLSASLARHSESNLTTD